MNNFAPPDKALWALDPDMVFLNHGSYGATPRFLQDVQTGWREKMERQPVRFMIETLPAELRKAADRLGTFTGARGEDIGFVENATAGINAVLRSLTFERDDEVIVTDHVYNAVLNTVRHVLETAGARLVGVDLGLPVPAPQAIHDRIMAAVTPATRLILIDHVASASAAILPVREIAATARATGVPLLVDGAHGPGLVDLNVPELGADWYVGNCHKWLCAPKGAGFLWAASDRQEGIHPPTISNAYETGFAAEFDMIGTRDASAWLSVPAAIDLHEAQGGPALRARNAAVAWAAAERFSERWGTRIGGSREQFAGMVTVEIPAGLPEGQKHAERLRTWIWENCRVELVISYFSGTHWLRLSVPGYITAADLDAAGPAVEAGLEALGV